MWDEWFEVYYRPLFRYSYLRLRSRSEAEDTVSQVFVEAFRGIGRYKHTGKPLLAWLYRIAHNVIFDRLKAKDDPKDPVCATEPGKGLLVYRDFGGKPLSGDELTEIEDGGVKFGFSFKPRVTGVALGGDELPKMSRKADTLGDEGHGRQIFRLVSVEE